MPPFVQQRGKVEPPQPRLLGPALPSCLSCLFLSCCRTGSFELVYPLSPKRLSPFSTCLYCILPFFFFLLPFFLFLSLPSFLFLSPPFFSFLSLYYSPLLDPSGITLSDPSTSGLCHFGLALAPCPNAWVRRCAGMCTKEDSVCNVTCTEYAVMCQPNTRTHVHEDHCEWIMAHQGPSAVLAQGGQPQDRKGGGLILKPCLVGTGMQ